MIKRLLLLLYCRLALLVRQDLHFTLLFSAMTANRCSAFYWLHGSNRASRFFILIWASRTCGLRLLPIVLLSRLLHIACTFMLMTEKKAMALVQFVVCLLRHTLEDCVAVREHHSICIGATTDKRLHVVILQSKTVKGANSSTLQTKTIVE